MHWKATGEPLCSAEPRPTCRMENETCLTRTLGSWDGYRNTTCRRDITCLKVLGQQRLRQRLRQLVTILPRNHKVESGTKLRECQRPIAIHIAQLPAGKTGTHFPSHYLRETYVCNHGGDRNATLRRGILMQEKHLCHLHLILTWTFVLGKMKQANFLVLTYRLFLF